MPDSGLSAQEHFIKQRRNLMIVSVLALLHAMGLSLHLPFISLNDSASSPLEQISAILLVGLLYLSIRYYQAFAETDYLATTKREIRVQRDLYLYRSLINVEYIEEGMSSFERHDIEHDFDFDDTPYTHLLSIDLDLKKRIGIYKLNPVGGRKKLTGIQYIFQRIRISLISCRAWLAFIIHRRSSLEYFFPFILAAVAILDLFGLGLSSGLIHSLSFLMSRGS